MCAFLSDFFFPPKKKTQPTPKVDRSDVERVIRRDYPPEQFDSVLSLLDEYGVKDYQKGKDRVQLAALKLASGSLDKLRRAIDLAKTDYRDVLVPSEFPRYSAEGFQIQKLSIKDYNRIIEEDWKQYNDWLGR